VNASATADNGAPARGEAADIVLFGASTDLGGRVAARLRGENLRVQMVSRRAAEPGWACADLEDRGAVRAAIGDAGTVVSCAHAMHAPAILEAAPATVRRFVLVGSAWRWSQVPEQGALRVQAAERVFLASGRDGVMLHPTMIYGGEQENNLRRLVELILRRSVIPLPGGGRGLVQPVHVDDVAAAVAAAAVRGWSGPHAIAVPGPRPMTWRRMADLCAAELGRRPIWVTLPLGPAIAALDLIRRLGLRPPVDPNVLRRLREDTDLPVEPLARELGVAPRPFETGLRQALAGWGLHPADAADR
jgi:nucleoside-diphosphate-sugar epimerase